jgi:hypothetical protein
VDNAQKIVTSVIEELCAALGTSEADIGGKLRFEGNIAT